MTQPSTLPTGFAGLVEILARLRAPDGCPWDREQTHESLLRYLLEESAEVVEAARSGDPAHLAEELGDVLLQVVFHAQIGTEAGTFTIDDVIKAISDKMVRRHPHVFGMGRAETSEDVRVLWQDIKAQEKAALGRPRSQSILDKVNKGLPALMRAQALQKKTAEVGFAWADPLGALAKVKEEVAEVEAEMRHPEKTADNRTRLREEYGDLLLAVAALGRYLDLDAEQELIHGNAKFEARFRAMEAAAGGAEALKALGIEQMMGRWEVAKAQVGGVDSQR